MSVSIIIPTWNEERCLPATLAALRSLGPCEIIVADGGSTDATPAAAAAADRLVTAPRGRAAQMNAGAGAATGGVLLFLHADCRLAPGALHAVPRALRRPRAVAGCFRMRVEAAGPLYRLIDAAATARVRLTGLVYGDQGLFLPRAVFDRLGGFPPVRFMEDVWLSRSLRRHGRVAVADCDILVSPRRWRRAGLVRQTLRNWTLTALAGAGVHPDRLARFYPVVR